MSLSVNIESLLGGVDLFLDDVFAIEAKFAAAEIAHEIELMRAGGLGNAAIKDALEADFAAKGPLFGRIDNSVRGHVVGSIIGASNGAQDEVYKDAGLDERRRWVVVNLGPNAAAKPCPDCPTRQGQVQTVIEWQDLGEPGTGWSICGPFCYCLLVPVEIEMTDRVDIL